MTTKTGEHCKDVRWRTNLQDLTPIVGIYKITNTKTNQVYVGQSVNVLSRWTSHVESLMKGKHPNKELQADFKKYGSSAFVAEIVCRCEPRQLDYEERLAIFRARRFTDTYNADNVTEFDHPYADRQYFLSRYGMRITGPRQRLRSATDVGVQNRGSRRPK